jgi:DNA processing protein
VIRLSPFHILILKGLPNVGPATIIKIISSEIIPGDLELYSDVIDTVKRVAPKTGENLTEDIVTKSIIEATEIIASCELLNVEIIGYCDDRYPLNYKAIGNSAPVIIYCKGDSSLLNSPKMVAVIGSREVSPQGIKAGRYVTQKLVHNGFIVVSGLALGCDTVGHEECLNSGGKTIAILAHGLDIISPKENIDLSERILESGCLVTEYPPYTKFNPNYFVARDRLQSGLSNGIVVIETNVKGGTIHTVNFALKQERAVACIDYNDSLVLPTNAGNRMLIENEKAFALSSRNIIEYIDIMVEGGASYEQGEFQF